MAQTITAIIPAKNEEHNIARCLESLKWCNRIIVMWMGNDDTGSIARKIGAKVVEMNRSADKDDFVAVQKNINWAIDNCQTDWIFRIDADEVVTEGLRKEIMNILAIGGRHGRDPDSAQRDIRASTGGKEMSDRIYRDDINAYGIPRRQYFLGKFLKGGDSAYDRLVRLFRPKFARFDPIVAVHEQFKVKGKIGYLKNHLLHYSHPTLKDVVRKFDSYTDLEATEVHENILFATFKMITQPPYIFLRWTIFHLGIRDGWRGVLAGALRGWYAFMLYGKYLSNRLKKLS